MVPFQLTRNSGGQESGVTASLTLGIHCRLTESRDSGEMVDRKRGNAPKSIGRFKVRKTLGHGAQGVVYLAFDPQLKREVAIKTMVQHLASRGSPDELLNEARTAAALRHPNTVQVYDCGQSDGIPYVVFEYVNGVSLKEVISSTGVMASDHAMGILVPVLEAIHYAHENGVVHRDLKPANVLIDDGGIPRVADFGIAGLLGGNAPGDMTGSAGYMPPEQLEARPLQRELDIFAIGVVLYEMVAGRLPIQASNVLEQLFRMAHDDIPPPSQFNTELSSAVDTIVMKAMERESSRRYADAKEFLTALNHFLKNDAAGEPGAAGVAPTKGGSGTLDFLIRRMSHTPDFPAMSQHVAEINRMASDGGDWSANALANVVLNDYSLTTKLLRLVNSPAVWPVRSRNRYRIAGDRGSWVQTGAARRIESAAVRTSAGRRGGRRTEGGGDGFVDERNHGTPDSGEDEIG